MENQTYGANINDYCGYSPSQLFITPKYKDLKDVPQSVLNKFNEIRKNAVSNLQSSNAELAYNAEENAFANNFKMTDQFKEWRDKHIDGGLGGDISDAVGTFIQEGAAIATICGQFTALFCSLYLLFFKTKEININFKNFKWNFNIVKNIYSVAVPSFFIISLTSFMVMGINYILTTISLLAVSIFGIYYKVQIF